MMKNLSSPLKIKNLMMMICFFVLGCSAKSSSSMLPSSKTLMTTANLCKPKKISVGQFDVILRHRCRRDYFSSSHNKALLVRGGSGPIAKEKEEDAILTTTEPLEATKQSSPSLTPLLLSVFLSSTAIATVMMSPAPIMIERFGAGKTTSILSSLSSLAAVFEIILSPIFGATIDSIGRKPAIVASTVSIAIVNAVVSRKTNAISVSASKLMSSIAFSQYSVAFSAILGDLMATSPGKLGSFIAIQSALISMGFAAGVNIAGRLSSIISIENGSNDGHSLLYSLSSLLSMISALIVAFMLPETLSNEKRIPFDTSMIVQKVMKAPVSAAHLLVGRGRKVRWLSLLYLVQIIPGCVGDVFQVYCSKVWGLAPKDFSVYVSAVIGSMFVGSLASSVLIRKMGVKSFTTLGILSSMCYPIGACISFRASLIGSLIGFVGGAQSFGVVAEITSKATEDSGANQGELAGERASLGALTKVFGPLLYGGMFLVGSNVGKPQILHAFNALLPLLALWITTQRVLW